MKQSINRWTQGVITFFHVQLFLSLATLPFLIFWGLPLSVLNCVGNFAFSPFLVAFLFVSTIIFFTELFCIPNGLCYFLLEKITASWHYCLSFGQHQWLIPIAQQWFWLFVCIAAVAFLTLHYKKNSSYSTTFFLLGLLSISLMTSFLLQTSGTNIIVACAKKHVTVTQTKRMLTLDDNGAFAQQRSAHSWVCYTLLPTLQKECGTHTIRSVTVQKAHTFTFETLIALIEETNIKTIVLPYFDGKNISKYGWSKYFTLKRLIEKQGITLVRSNTLKKKTPLQ